MLSNKLLTTSTEVVPDAPQMNYVTALLHADGTNGAQNNTFINQTLPLGAGYNVGYFDGTGDYLSITDNGAFDFGTGAFTVEAWVMPMSFPTDGNSIVAGIGPTNGDWMLAMTSAADVRWGRNHVAWDLITSGVTFVANTWYHIAVCKTGSTLRIYVDGIQRASASNTRSYNIANSTLAVGARQLTNSVLGAGEFFNGYISNLRILKGVALYTANFTVPTSPLTAITGTSLLTCNNTTFTDSSSNNFTVTANGDTSVVNLLQTLTRNGDVTQGSFSPYGDLWSNYFNGSTGYLTVADNDALDLGTFDFTVELYVFPVGGSSNFPRLLTKGATGLVSSWCLGIDYTTNGIFLEYGTTPNYTGIAGVLRNSWNHVAVVRSAGIVTIYLNGIASTPVTIADNLFSSTALFIGRDDTNFDYLQGYISNARIVKGTAVYTSNFTPPIAPLVAVSGTSLLTCQSNRLLDASSNNFAITRNGDVKVTKFSPFIPTSSYDPVVLGGSAYFDRNGDFLTLPDNDAFELGSGAFTVESWCYLTGYSASYSGFYAACILAKDITTSRGFEFRITGTASSYTNLQALLFSSNSVFTAPGASANISLDTWHHIAFTRTAGTARVFLNGQMLTEVVDTTSIQNTTADVVVGGTQYTGFAQFFPGYISDLKVVKGTALYTANFTPPTAPLLPTTNTSLLLSATNAGIFDSAVKGNWETEGTAQLSTSVKKFGTASLYFDGSSTSRLFTPYSINHVFGSGNFTIEYWCYPTLVTSATRRHISMEEANHTFIIRQNGTLMQIVFRFGSSTVVSANASVNFTLNTWQHVALVRNGSSFVLYKDGISVASLTNSGSINQTTAAILVGGSAGNESFQGYMDEVRITKGIARYTGNFTPPTEPFADY
jgi:hypothetical protein